MEVKNTILQELQEISPAVANLQKGNLYSLPNGYFDALPEEILAKAQLTNLLGGVKNTLYTTPNGYFSQLPENILAKAKLGNTVLNDVAEELESIAPLLNTISKENVYRLPVDYFASLNILLPQKEKAKVISLGNWKKVMKYAVAAVFAGVLGVGGIKYALNSSMPASFNTELQKTSDEELKQVLDAHASTAFSSTSVVNDDQEEYSIFEGTTEEELQQYLKEQPETAEKANSGS